MMMAWVWIEVYYVHLFSIFKLTSTWLSLNWTAGHLSIFYVTTINIFRTQKMEQRTKDKDIG